MGFGQAAARRIAGWRAALCAGVLFFSAEQQHKGSAPRLTTESALRMFLTSRMKLPLCLAVGLALSPFGSQAQQHPANDIDRAFRYLYNFEFQEAHRVLDRVERQNPENPMASAARGAVYLFTELDRLDLLASEFFQDRGDRIQKKKVAPDPAVRDKLFQATGRAREFAHKVLAADPKNTDALFALSTAAGIESDYLFFVEKKRLGSLKLHKESHNYCQQLLEIDPDYPDAYLTSGFYEYLVGDLPFFLRWFIRFDGVEGDKEKGIERLKFVSKNARYSAGFAKVLLAAVYLREKRPADSVEMLADLSREYPNNPLFPREVVRICEENKLAVPSEIAAREADGGSGGTHSTRP